MGTRAAQARVPIDIISHKFSNYQGCSLEGLVIVSSLELDELVRKIGGFFSSLILAFYFIISTSSFQNKKLC